MYFISTRAVNSLVMEGERLYYSSAHPQGKPVRPSVWSNFGPIQAEANEKVLWTPNGYKAYENTVRHGSVVHEWVWTVSGYPGSWYYYAKSVKFHMTASSYRFFDPTDLGQNPTGSGWHPY